MTISASNYHRIQELQNQKDITILHGGMGGYNRPTVSLCMFLSNQERRMKIKMMNYDVTILLSF